MSRYEERTVDRRPAYTERLAAAFRKLAPAEADNAWFNHRARVRRGELVQARAAAGAPAPVPAPLPVPVPAAKVLPWRKKA